MADFASSLFSSRNLRRSLPWLVIVVAALVLPAVLPPFRLNLLGRFLSLGIGVLSYIVGSGSLLLVWPAMPAGLNDLITFFATTSMAKVLVFALIVVFLQIRPAGLFPQKGRMVEA